MTRSPLSLFIALVTVISVLLPGSAHATEERPILLGFATEDPVGVFSAFEDATGRHPAFYQVFSVIDGGGRANLPDLLEVAYGTGATPYVEVQVEDFDALLRGDLDADLDALVEKLMRPLRASATRRVLIAPMPEFNLPTHPYGGQPDRFPAAYRKVRKAFVDAGATPDRVRFVLSYLGGKPGGIEYGSYYPGDETVDVIGFSKINRNSPWKDYDESFGSFIRDLGAELTSTKPIMATQTGSVDEDGDRDAWLRDMFRNLAAEPQVIGAIYFNRHKFELGKDNDYRIITPDRVDPVLVAEQRAWSDPALVEWIFDGRLDDWVQARAATQSDVRFIDTVGSPFAPDIEWLAAEGITKGCAERRFCPDDPVSRQQMAAFLVRALGLDAGDESPFVDDDDSVFEADIAALAASGITTGCGGDRFCPESHVTRGQMAAFLHRAFPARKLIRPSTTFVDSHASRFANDIAWLSATGITEGCGDDRFCPDGPVTRSQMAAFLRRALTS